MATKRGGQVLLFGMLLSALFVVWALTATLAHATDGGVLPAHQASVEDVGPCTIGSHWVLTGADGVTSAILTVDGVEYPMSPNGAGHEWDADAGPTTDQTVAFVTYVGTLTENAQLNLSHCEEGSPSPTPTPTPTPSPSPSPSESPTPPPTSTSTPPPSSGTSTPPVTKPGTHTPSSPTPSVRPTAFTGSRAATLGAVAALLLLMGLVALRVGTTRRTARR